MSFSRFSSARALLFACTWLAMATSACQFRILGLDSDLAGAGAGGGSNSGGGGGGGVTLSAYCATGSRASATPFAGGDGSALTPYQICSVAQLNEVRNFLGSRFRLETDLQLPAVSDNFEPIGSSATPFTGIFDGNHFRILGLDFSDSSRDEVGLFANISLGAQIQNLTLENVTLHGRDTVGALVGTYRGSITNCHVRNGSVQGVNDVGGLAGSQTGGGVIMNSSANVSVQGSTDVGGLIGYAAGSRSVQGTFAAGSVSGLRYVGGLIGLTGSIVVLESFATGGVSASADTAGGLIGRVSGTEIRDSYATGSVSSANHTAGGLFGFIFSTPGVSFSYATGVVTAPSSAGGAVGSVSGAPLLRSVFWDKDTSAISTSAGGTGLRTYHFSDKSIFKGWAFGAVWLRPEDAGLPAGHPIFRSSVDLSGPYCENATNLAASPFAGGSGTSGDPWLICTATQLDQVRTQLAGHFKLMQDIDLSGMANTFLPIGSFVSPFTGTFDGNGFEVRNLTYTVAPLNDGHGLFSSINGTVRNLGVVDYDLAGDDGVGGLSGDIQSSGVVEDCYSIGTIGLENSGAGGLVGVAYGGVIRRSYSISTITGPAGWGGDIGGLVGSLTNSSVVEDSFSRGTITGYQRLGGFTGQIVSSASVRRSYSLADVSGVGLIGGIAGFMSGTEIMDSFSEGSVAASQTNVGGLVGRSNGGSIVRSWSKSSVQGYQGVGGAAGLLDSGTLTEVYNTGTVTGVGATSDYVGSLVGNGASATVITRSYATGVVTVSTSGTNIGGLAGFLSGFSDVSHSYWATDTTGQATSAGGTARTSTQLQSRANIIGWHWGKTWINPADVGLPAGPPVLRSQVIYDLSHCANVANSSASPFAGGDGTAGNPYLICTPTQLNEVRNHLSSNFKLMQDVDLASMANSFPPIGDGATPFTGSFDGNGFRVKNFTYTTSTSGSRHGLFGTTTGATVSNLGVEDVDVNGNSSIGGLIGRADPGTSVSNCYASGAVAASWWPGGGLIGYLDSSTVTGSYADVTVSELCLGPCGSAGYSGGLVGAGWGASISDSYALGDVSNSADRMGGLIGSADGVGVSNSYALGDVTARTAVGGLIGYATWSSNFTNSFAGGSISGSGNQVGGFAGHLNQGSTATAVYATGNVASTGSDVGGLVGELANGSDILRGTAYGNASAAGAVGGLVGYARHAGTTIVDSSARGSAEANVTGDVGGLVGKAVQMSIADSYATGSVGSGLLPERDGLGGLVGYASYTSITRSYATGPVNGDNALGGLIGWMEGGSVLDAYANGSVSSIGSNQIQIGGAIGRLTSSPSITNIYADSVITGGLSNVGGLVGGLDGTEIVSASYWNSDRYATSPAGSGLTGAQMQVQSNFTGWDFTAGTGIWFMPGGGPPQLQ